MPKDAKAGGKGAGTDVRLDTEWIAEHAAQVTRMLPGGEPTVRLPANVAAPIAQFPRQNQLKHHAVSPSRSSRQHMDRYLSTPRVPAMQESMSCN